MPEHYIVSMRGEKVSLCETSETFTGCLRGAADSIDFIASHLKVKPDTLFPQS